LAQVQALVELHEPATKRISGNKIGFARGAIGVESARVGHPFALKESTTEEADLQALSTANEQ